MSGDSSKPVEAAAKPAAAPKASGKGQQTVPWNPWLGVLFAVAVFFTTQVVAAVSVFAYGDLTGKGSPREITEWLADSTGAQFIYVLLVESLTLAALFMFLKRYKLGFSSIGLKRPRWIDPVYGLAAVVPYFIVLGLTVALVSQLVPGFNADQKQEIGFESVQGGLQLGLTFLSLVVLPAFTEEVVVRGFVYTSLRKAMPVIYAAIVASGLFAAAHLSESSSGLLYIAALDTFILSLFLIGLRQKTDSLWASITLHAIKNSVAFVALFAHHFK